MINKSNICCLRAPSDNFLTLPVGRQKAPSPLFQGQKGKSNYSGCAGCSSTNPPLVPPSASALITAHVVLFTFRVLDLRSAHRLHSRRIQFAAAISTALSFCRRPNYRVNCGWFEFWRAERTDCRFYVVTPLLQVFKSRQKLKRRKKSLEKRAE